MIQIYPKDRLTIISENIKFFNHFEIEKFLIATAHLISWKYSKILLQALSTISGTWKQPKCPLTGIYKE